MITAEEEIAVEGVRALEFAGKKTGPSMDPSSLSGPSEACCAAGGADKVQVSE